MLVDVFLQESFMEFRPEGIVDESLLLLVLLSSCTVLEDHIVIPPFITDKNNNNNNNNNNKLSFSAHVCHSVTLLAVNHYYSGFSPAAIAALKHYKE